MVNFPVAIVTGASRGIGESVAKGLAEIGYKTIIIARSKEKLESVASEIKSIVREKNDLIPDIYVTDVTDSERLKENIKEIINKYKRIDVLVNNAGILNKGTLDQNLNDFKDLMETNLFSPYVILKEVVPVMKKAGSGYIFNIASRAGKIGFPDSGVYCASKFALVGFSESLYKSIAKDGIKITSICPSWVNTQMAQDAGAKMPTEEMIQPEDITKTIQWLLTLSPSTFIKEVMIECKTRIR
ncbi:SDR family oxidoreductase [Bacteroidota bacterium]